MSYYFFNRKELLQKAKDKYHNSCDKEKPTKYYLENKDVLKENSKNKYRNFSVKKKKQSESMEEIGIEK